MRKTQYDNKPNAIEHEGQTVRINFDIAETTLATQSTTDKDEEQPTRTIYECYSVRMEQPVTRDRVVSAIIDAQYPSDEMQAIVNNHLLNIATLADGNTLDESETEHEAEYQAMQDWRKKAKEVAKEILSE